MSSYNERIDLLEKKLQVLTSEFNSVLQEIQVTMEGLAKLSKVGIQTLDRRLLELEDRLRKREPEAAESNGSPTNVEL